MAKSKKSIVALISAIASLLTVVSLCFSLSVTVQKLKCEHVWEVGEVKVESTCTKEGVLVMECEECGKHETKKTEKLAHTWTLLDAKEATCTEKGYTQHTGCEVCGAVKPGETVEFYPATGHTEVDVAAVAVTCTESGWTAGKKCATCEEIIVAPKEISATGHTVLNSTGRVATCADSGRTSGEVCATCNIALSGYELVERLAHTDTDADGQCEVCGLTEAGYNFGYGTYRIYRIVKDEMSSTSYDICLAQFDSYPLTLGVNIPYYGESATLYDAVRNNVGSQCQVYEFTALTDDYLEFVYRPGVAKIYDGMFYVQAPDLGDEAWGCGVMSSFPLYKVSDATDGADHADTNGDGMCESCGVEITFFMKETAVAVGDKLAGNWYRVYQQDISWTGTRVGNGDIGIDFGGGSVVVIGAHERGSSGGLLPVYSGIVSVSDGLIVIPSKDYEYVSDGSCPRYYDIYIPEYLSIATAADGTVEITSETEIVSFSKNAVYRLVSATE